MNTITVGQLRQNPTAMLDQVEHGETFHVTRHGREIALIVPSGAGEASDAPNSVPRKPKGRMRLRDLPRHELRTADSIDELLEDMKGEW